MAHFILIYGVKTTVLAAQHVIRATKTFKALFITSFSRKRLSGLNYFRFRIAYLLTLYSISNHTKLVVHLVVRFILFCGVKTTTVSAQHVIRVTKTFESFSLTSFIIKIWSRFGFIITYLLTLWSIYNVLKLVVRQFLCVVLVYAVKTTLVAGQQVIRATKTSKALFSLLLSERVDHRLDS